MFTVAVNLVSALLTVAVSTAGPTPTPLPTNPPSLLSISGHGGLAAYEVKGDDFVPLTAFLDARGTAARLDYGAETLASALGCHLVSLPGRPLMACKYMTPAIGGFITEFTPDSSVVGCEANQVDAVWWTKAKPAPIHLRETFGLQALIRSDGDPPEPGGTDRQQTMQFSTFILLCPGITLQPSLTVSPGTDTLAIAATDFDPVRANARVKDVLVDGVLKGTFQPGQSASLRVPDACGTHVVTLTQSIAAGLLQASTPLVVTCPTIEVTPSSITLTDEPAPVEVTGSGFPSYKRLDVEVNGSTVTTTPSDGTGSVGLALSTAGLPCGQSTVVLTLNRDPRATASAPLTVTCPVSAGSVGSVTVSPDTVMTGSPALVTGSGFAPGAALTLAWTLADGTREPVAGGVTTAGPDGSFAFYTMVFVGDPAGSRALTATDGPTSATGSLLVVNGTLQPVDGTQLAMRR